MQFATQQLTRSSARIGQRIERSGRSIPVKIGDRNGPLVEFCPRSPPIPTAKAGLGVGKFNHCNTDSLDPCFVDSLALLHGNKVLQKSCFEFDLFVQLNCTEVAHAETLELNLERSVRHNRRLCREEGRRRSRRRSGDFFHCCLLEDGYCRHRRWSRGRWSAGCRFPARLAGFDRWHIRWLRRRGCRWRLGWCFCGLWSLWR